ncbi:MAG: hypothetical protein JW718_02660 [Desulfovibrionaceae bacterium]|nr:hypothetical protein [Desulfovibrionaceae bacterium]
MEPLVIWQCADDSAGPGGTWLLGKRFDVERVAPEPRVIVHEDYPLLGLDDVSRFVRCAAESPLATISGCRVEDDHHPYRLLSADADGYASYAVDVPQEIRGSRQRYPAVYRYVPALIFVPAGVPFPSAPAEGVTAMCRLEREKLLDRSNVLENLEIILQVREAAGV